MRNAYAAGDRSTQELYGASEPPRWLRTGGRDTDDGTEAERKVPYLTLVTRRELGASILPFKGREVEAIGCRISIYEIVTALRDAKIEIEA